VIAGEHACPRCAASPLCDRCGHQRESHTGVFRDGARMCKHVWLDLPSLSKLACECDGFAPVTGAFSDAAFAVADEDEFELRLA
jgi:Zn-finger nucleic acid-binding protein